MRIVFMGTPDFAEGILNDMINKGWQVVGVVTSPDRPAGRGLKLHESEVKKLAIKHNIPYLQPEKLKDEFFLKDLNSWRADVFVVVAFRMLPKEVWKMPNKGTFNLHASLLPKYRGAAPIHWAIANGETKTGVTTFFIDDKIDTGDIIAQKEIAIDFEDTLGTLFPKLMTLGAQLVDETLLKIKNDEVVLTEQNNNENLLAAPKFNKENTCINWDKRAIDIYNFVRGLNPFPVAWSSLKVGEEITTVKIYDVSLVGLNEFEIALKPGEILIVKGRWLVGCHDGLVEIRQLQLSGKRKMDVKELLNGIKFAENPLFLVNESI